MSTCPPSPSRRTRAWPSDVPAASRAPVGEVDQRPALGVESPAPAPPLAAWEHVAAPDVCAPTPRASFCEPDAEPVFAQPWRPKATSAEPWAAWDDPRVVAALEGDLQRLLDVVAGRVTRQPVVERYVGRPGFETWAPLGDVGELAGGRTGDDAMTFDPLETS